MSRRKRLVCLLSGMGAVTALAAFFFLRTGPQDESQSDAKATSMAFRFESTDWIDDRYSPGLLPDQTVEEFTFSPRRFNRQSVLEYAAEINRLGLTRLQLDNRPHLISDPMHEADQEFLLSQLTENCPGLTYLSVNEWTVSGELLAGILERLPLLTELRFSHCRLQGEWPEAVAARSDSLRKLAIGGYDINNRLLTGLIDAAPNVEELSVSYYSRQNDPELSNFDLPVERIKYLSLGGPVTDAMLADLISRAKQLETLQVGSCPRVTGTGWFSEVSSSFRALEISRCAGITDDSFQAIINDVPGLEELSLYRCDGITGTDIELPAVRKLKVLRLSGKQIQPEFVARCLKSARDLRVLALTNLQGVPEFDVSFQNLQELHELSLVGCPVSSRSLESLPGGIETLKLSKSLTPASFHVLTRKLSNLKSLEIQSGWPKSTTIEAGASEEKTSYPGFSNLRELDLRNPSDADIQAILRSAPRLQRLKIARGSLFTGVNCGFESHLSLQELDLGSLSRLDDGLMQQLPPKLESLRMSYCPVTGEGWDLQRCSQLQRLSLRNLDDLREVGERLPDSLVDFRMYYCRKFRGDLVDYSNLHKLQVLFLSESHDLNSDHLFATLPRPSNLLALHLAACPPPSGPVDLSPLKGSLESLFYPEGDTSLTGGIDDATAKDFQRQLPDCKIRWK